jgi:transposase
MDERLRFDARLLEGEKTAVVGRVFDISRKTGYRILSRYTGLRDGRSHRPLPPSVSVRKPAAVSGGAADRAAQARAPEPGCAEDP